MATLLRKRFDGRTALLFGVCVFIVEAFVLAICGYAYQEFWLNVETVALGTVDLMIALVLFALPQVMIVGLWRTDMVVRMDETRGRLLVGMWLRGWCLYEWDYDLMYRELKVESQMGDDGKDVVLLELHVDQCIDAVVIGEGLSQCYEVKKEDVLAVISKVKAMRCESGA